MKIFIILSLATVALYSCNKVKDPKPESAKVPDTVIKTLEKSYQNPQKMIFTEIVKNRVWTADFESGSKKYNAALNPEVFISAYRLAETPVPDSLKNLPARGSIGGGEYSNFREEEYSWYREGNYGKGYLADYLWSGEQWLFRWGVTNISGRITYNLDVVPYKTKVTTLELKDLPETIQQHISSKKFQFERATISVDGAGKKSYSVSVKEGNSSFGIWFDNDLKLVGGSKTSTYLANTNQLPTVILNYILASPYLAGYGFTGQFAGLFKNEYDGIITYSVNMEKHYGTISGSQAWFMTLDSNGKLISRSYMALY